MNLPGVSGDSRLAVLARWMKGRWRDDDGVADEGAIEEWLGLAWSEGVVALTAAGLSACVDAPRALRDAFTIAAKGSALSSLSNKAECQRVLERLAEHGIPALLLKGSASAHWLYPEPYLRECSDIDLMLDGREQLVQAAGALVGLGYATVYTPGGFGHTWLCARPFGSGRMEVDLHLRLSGMPLFAGAFAFDELRGQAMPIPALGPHACGLSPAHALLHACVHRVSNIAAGIGDRLKWLYEIHLLAARLDDADWQAVHGFARTHGMCGICMDALGSASDRFGVAVPDAWLAHLRDAAANEALDVARLRDWSYMQWQNLTALPSIRARMKWLWYRLFPSAGYMQAIYERPVGKWSGLRLRWQRLWQRLRHKD